MNPVSDKSPIKDSEVQFGASLDLKICVPWKGDLEVINTGQKESTFAVIELLYTVHSGSENNLVVEPPLGKI